MAHNDIYCFSKLIDLLDDERNDIFVHIDKKVDIKPFKQVNHNKSNIYFTERIEDRWGDISLVKTEYILLKAAYNNNQSYSYYHLISGVDLPLKTQDQLHDFFDKYQGKEFVGLAAPFSKEAEKRVKYHRLVRYHRSPYLVLRIADKVLDRLFVQVQRLLHLERKYDEIFTMGPQWFSITEDLVKYVLDDEEKVMDFCSHSTCSDEVFLPTLVRNSSFKDRIYNEEQYASCLREIDFKRGNPWTWRNDDYEHLIHSDRMFARKFSSAIDKTIIDRIYDYLKTKS